MTALVALEAVWRTYLTRAEAIHAVADVSFELHPGSLTALVGPSGSGKTTLMNLIVGWEDPDSGVIRRHPDIGEDWKSVGVVPQGLGLLPELTILENIGLPGVLGNPTIGDAKELCASIGLAEVAHQLPEAVSLGEHQRAAVARALITQPRLLIADEPTAHQDEPNTMLVTGMLRAASAAGSAVLIATHDPRVLVAADTIIHILDGRLQL